MDYRSMGMAPPAAFRYDTGIAQSITPALQSAIPLQTKSPRRR